MKLLYITNGINGAGGLERVLSVKASYFADYMNYDVTILSLNNGNDNPFYEFSSKIKFKSINVGGNPLQYILSYKKGIQHTIDEVKPDVILVCDDGLKAFFLPTIIKTKAKWIYERHVSKLIEANDNDSYLKQKSNQLKWKLMEVYGKTYHHFVVLTEGNKKEWKSLNNLEVISNPLSFIPKFTSNLENKIVICVGKISYQKGQDMLIKAWEKVNTHAPEWQLHLYGKEDLNFLDTKKLQNNILFFPPEKDIQKKYVESSIYVMPSRYEGFGMVLTEAMSCGIPCVAFDCNYGPSDIIENGKDGLLVESNNIDQLADQLLLMINDYDLRLALGLKAKVSVTRYSIKNIANQWDSLFKN